MYTIYRWKTFYFLIQENLTNLNLVANLIGLRGWWWHGSWKRNQSMPLTRGVLHLWTSYYFFLLKHIFVSAVGGLNRNMNNVQHTLLVILLRKIKLRWRIKNGSSMTRGIQMLHQNSHDVSLWWIHYASKAYCYTWK